MGGRHEAAVRVLNRDGVKGWSFVNDGGVNGAKVGGTASVGNGEVGCYWLGGRTYISGWRFAVVCRYGNSCGMS